ncbi:unnamed protein product [Orchesella dallaii]|uniref:Uncharacterized protein n=1 Tax=Orchesella dallaii TaxID=48710 RepID=A0ABP1R4L4_9HEXA
MKDQEESRVDYLCEDAIALLQPVERRKEAIIMWFDLLDGSDKVYAGNDAQINLFRVGNGIKYFVGGYRSRNEFLFDEDCQPLAGTLVGGDNYQDALTVLKNCSKGQWMEFDFETGQVRNQNGNLGIAISLIDEINGRENEQDILFAGCDLRKAMLGGGVKGNPDKIRIRPRENCKYNFTAVLGDFTEIESAARSGAVTLLLGSSFKSVSATLDIYKTDSQTLQLVFLSTASSQVNIESMIQKDHHLFLNINKIGTGDSMAVTLNVLPEQPDHPIYFTETPSGSPDSILMLHLDSPPVFYHSLTEIDTKAARERSESTNTANFFDITGENWNVIGGDQDDQFILHSPHFTSINGKGGVDTLTLHKDIKSDVTIYLTNKIQFNNLEIVNGIPGQKMTVGTESSTKTVASMGGPDSKPDVVHVIAELCSQRELKIIVIGNTKVEIASEMGPPSQDNILHGYEVSLQVYLQGFCVCEMREREEKCAV